VVGSSVAEPELAELELAEPYLREVLGTVGLDVEYVRASGNTLYYRDADGNEVPVLDLACGFGSLILGHHHPELVRCAKDLLDAQVPIHAQFSRHPYANRLAAELNRIITRELGDPEPYWAIFGNSGAEAVEISIKHAELDRGMRLTELTAEVDAGLTAAREAVARGATIAPRVFEALGLPGTATIDAVADAIAARTAELTARGPVFLALEGGFHGKLVGSIQLTHNEGYRTPFTRLASRTRFVSVGDVQGLWKIVEEEQLHLAVPTVEGDTVTVTERPLPVIGGFFVEPVQGEAGIRVLPAEFGVEISRVCARTGAPLIVDEIQSGMGRSGSFLASSGLGLRGDYYLLAKSLGGGVAKSSVMLVRGSRYRREFELVHSSTFAKDAFSCFVGLRVLELLEADGGAAYGLARDRGAALRERLAGVWADFPDVVLDVRGVGLMLGLEFRDQSGSGSGPIAEAARSGFFGFAVAGYALRAHRLRLFQTASAMNTFRFEPSIHLSDAELDQIDTGLRDICELLRAGDGQRLLGTA
jgi:acetylornithine/succinyldiaminopimelate/putrescine aminotransferase